MSAFMSTQHIDNVKIDGRKTVYQHCIAPLPHNYLGIAIGMKRITVNAGDSYGRLTVVSEAESTIKNGVCRRWVHCICECGEEKTIRLKFLRKGVNKSCGCVSKFKRHGLTNTREYRSWKKMNERINSPSSDVYQYYGGRGIKIDPRWQDFERFIEDMGSCPKGHSIERIDVNGDYTPSNCKWASQAEQTLNKTNSVIWIIGDNEYEGISAAIKASGLTKSTLFRRCKGYKANGKHHPPADGFGFRLKYPES